MIFTRHGFTAPDPAGRQIYNDDIERTFNEEKETLTVNLSKSSLEKLFNVAVGDPTDRKWLEEKERMVRQYKAQGLSDAEIEQELKTNKPLGREQKTIQKQQNIAESSLSLSDKLKEIDEEVKSGKVVSTQERAALTGQLAAVLNRVDVTGGIIGPELLRLSNLIQSLNVPTTYQGLGIPFRFIDIDYFKRISGLVSLLLFSKAKERPLVGLYERDNNIKRFDIDPVKGVPTAAVHGVRPDREGAVKMQAAVKGMNTADDKRLFLDLERGGLINMAQLKQFMSKSDPSLFAINPAYITP